MEQTWELGRALARTLEPEDVVTLHGPFGAGKTALVRGIAEGLGARDWLASPSFALANEYLPAETGVRLPLFHLDLYRLRDGDDAFGIGLDEYLSRAGVVVVEWPDAAAEALPADRLEVEIAYGDDEVRRIELRPRGRRAREIAEALALGPP